MIPEALFSPQWGASPGQVDDKDWVHPLPTGQHAISRAMRSKKAEIEEAKVEESQQRKRKASWASWGRPIATHVSPCLEDTWCVSGFNSTFLVWKIFDVHLRSIHLFGRYLMCLVWILLFLFGRHWMYIWEVYFCLSSFGPLLTMRKCQMCLVGETYCNLCLVLTLPSSCLEDIRCVSDFNSKFLVWKMFDVHLRSVFLSLKFLGHMMRKCQKCLVGEIYCHLCLVLTQHMSLLVWNIFDVCLVWVLNFLFGRYVMYIWEVYFCLSSFGTYDEKVSKVSGWGDLLQIMSGSDSTYVSPCLEYIWCVPGLSSKFLVWKILDVHLRSVFLSLKFLGHMMRKCQKCLVGEIYCHLCLVLTQHMSLLVWNIFDVCLVWVLNFLFGRYWMYIWEVYFSLSSFWDICWESVKSVWLGRSIATCVWFWLYLPPCLEDTWCVSGFNSRRYLI